MVSLIRLPVREKKSKYSFVVDYEKIEPFIASQDQELEFKMLNEELVEIMKQVLT
jgi:hypothetical protein